MGPWPAHCAQTGARCPSDGPDVRGFATGRMSGQGGRMSGLAWPVSELSVGGVRMSGLGAGCPAAREGPDVRASCRMSGLTGFSFGCLV